MPTDQQRISHLLRSVGPDALILEHQNAHLVSSPAVPQAIADQALAAVCLTQSSLFNWLRSMRVHVPHPHTTLQLGLFHDQKTYELYLLREGMTGLSGSQGATHPVRLVALAVIPASPSSYASAATVLAHESIHLYLLKSGICPSWDAWPRWLHEGLAMMGDHLPELASTQLQPRRSFATLPFAETNSLHFASINPHRAKDWATFAPTFDFPAFLGRDITRNQLSHKADYAASWAFTTALARWNNGQLFCQFLNFLHVRQLQPETSQSLEIESRHWLVSELATSWPVFIESARTIHKA